MPNHDFILQLRLFLWIHQISQIVDYSRYWTYWGTPNLVYPPHPCIYRAAYFLSYYDYESTSFQGSCRAEEKEMGLGRAILIQMLLSLLKFSRFSQGNMPLFVSTLLLISTVLKVLTLTVCCQCLPCFYEEKHFCSPSAIVGSPTPPFHYFFPVEFNMFFITKNTDFPKWIS